jgi:hypothetical protein
MTVLLPAWLGPEYAGVVGPMTRELAGDMILFGVAEALTANREYADPDYWVEQATSAGWWLFGASGQGDQWWLARQGGVWFFDHDLGLRDPERFVDVRLDPTGWISVGEVVGRFESSEPTPVSERMVVAELEARAPGLLDRWPYRLI